jgi:hypothetical protein
LARSAEDLTPVCSDWTIFTEDLPDCKHGLAQGGLSALAIGSGPEAVLENSPIKSLASVVDEESEKFARFCGGQFGEADLVAIEGEFRFKLDDDPHNFNSIVKLVRRLARSRDPNKKISQTVVDDDPKRFVR